jgi:hypothetical protein
VNIRPTATVTRGRITVLDRMEYREFIANPNEFSDAKSTDWGEAHVPGASHPVYGFGSGGERLITFELHIDGDRNPKARSANQDRIDISQELFWYRSLIYPYQMNGKESQVAPSLVSFTYGTMWSSVLCVVKKADYKITRFSSSGTAMRGTISLALAEVVKKSQVWSDVDRDNTRFRATEI